MNFNNFLKSSSLNEGIIKYNPNYIIHTDEETKTLIEKINNRNLRDIVRFCSFKYKEYFYYVALEKRVDKDNDKVLEPHFGAFKNIDEYQAEILINKLKAKKDVLKFTKDIDTNINAQEILSYVYSITKDYVDSSNVKYLKFVSNFETTMHYIRFLRFIYKDINFIPVYYGNENRKNFEDKDERFFFIKLKKYQNTSNIPRNFINYFIKKCENEGTSNSVSIEGILKELNIIRCN